MQEINGATEWLKSPISIRQERMQPHQNSLLIQPYQGNKKRTRLYHSSYTIGTDPSCEFRLSDPFLSTKHARIFLRPGGEGYEIEDLSSKNGVFLNGLRIEKALMPRQGILRVGRSTFSWKENTDSELDFFDHDWVCEDPFLQETLNRLKGIASSKLPILLLGETGTGKDYIANLIHKWSMRGKQAFIAMNAANAGGSLVDSELFGHSKGAYTGSDSKRLGALMSAHHGTLFLDEVADLAQETQVKLLRSIESGEVKALGSDRIEYSDFRLISATSQNLEKKILGGQFRIDLYYRLAGFIVHIPPLRERPKDIIAITKKILEKKGLLLEKECEGVLLSFTWPGNIRELKSTIERAITLAQAEGATQIQTHHLILTGQKMNIIPTNKELITLENMEKQLIQSTLQKTGWSRLASAKALGIARSTLFEKMRRYGIRDSLNY